MGPMANGNLFRAQMCLGLTICLTGISYWLFWQSAIAQPMLISAWFTRKSNASISCWSDLLLDFDVANLNLSAPIYVKLAKPRPISSACGSLLPKSDNSTVTNFVKLELLSTDEQARLPSIVHGLLANFSQRNLELFLAGGSLLGSVRHFGHFPWDADADVMIPVQQKSRVRQLLIELSESGEMRFADTERVNQHWQLGIFCPADRNHSSQHHGVMYSLSQPSPAKSCKTIVDFFFGHAGAKRYTRAEYPMTFPIQDVYPLRLRPYGTYLMPVPRNPDKFLTAVYGNDYEIKCAFKYFKGKSYKCADLRSIYPFVTHLRLPYMDRQLSVDLLVRGSNMLALFIPEQA